MRNLDFPISSDDSTFFISWIIGFIIYFVIFLSLVLFSVNHLANIWQVGLSKDLTVQVIPDINQDMDDKKSFYDGLLELVLPVKGVITARYLEDEEVNELLLPWLGSVDNWDEIVNMPRLVALEVDRNQGFKIEELKERLVNFPARIVIDDHYSWLQEKFSFFEKIRLLIVLWLMSLVFSCLIIVIYATKTSFARYNHIIEMLHLVGALDNYIAGQFARASVSQSIYGGLIGILMAVLTLLGINYLQEYEGVFVFLFYPIITSVSYWLTVLCILLILVSVVGITSWNTALGKLARMP